MGKALSSTIIFVVSSILLYGCVKSVKEKSPEVIGKQFVSSQIQGDKKYMKSLAVSEIKRKIEGTEITDGPVRIKNLVHRIVLVYFEKNGDYVVAIYKDPSFNVYFPILLVDTPKGWRVNNFNENIDYWKLGARGVLSPDLLSDSMVSPEEAEKFLKKMEDENYRKNYFKKLDKNLRRKLTDEQSWAEEEFRKQAKIAKELTEKMQDK